MKKLLYIFYLLAIPMMLQSCLHDDEDKFDQSATARVQTLADTTRNILTANTKGWVLQYFPALQFGGYNYVISFNGETATVSCEIADPDYTETCLFDIISEDGAMLTFNTYSELMHYFREPSGGAVDGMGGDYEFRVVSATPELITLQGRTNGNTMYMFPMPEGYTRETYLKAINNMQADLIDGTYKVYTTDDDLLGNTTSESDGRYLEFSYEQVDSTGMVQVVTQTESLIYTLTGVKFYNDVKLVTDEKDNGYFHGQNFTYDAATGYLTATDGDLKLKGEVQPKLAYADMLGTWKFNYGASSATITISQLVADKSYTVTGLLFPFVMNYSNGKFYIYAQKVGTSGANDVWMCPWDTVEGYLTWETTVGLKGIWNGDNSTPVISFVDNGVWGSYVASGFLLWNLTSAGTSAGQYGVQYGNPITISK